MLDKEISKDIKKVYLAYFGIELSGAVAYRSSGDFYAVLFPTKRANKFEAIVFNYGFKGYEVTDDGLIFPSIKAFKNEGLVKRFF